MFGIDTWGLDVVLWIQAWRTPLAIALSLVAQELGGFAAPIVLLPIVYWCVDRRFGAKLVIWFLAGIYINSLLKEAFGLPRPYFDASNGVLNLADEPSQGLPSGHAQSAVMFWGIVATYVRRRWVWVAVALYAAVIGLSRVTLGVHYPQDVIAGWLLGAAWVGLYVVMDGRMAAWMENVPTWGRLALSGVVGLGVAALLPSRDGATYGGALFGLGAGLSLAGKWAAFDAGGVWWRRVARYFAGALGLLILQSGLGTAFEGLEPQLVLRFVRYALMGVWMTLGAPWLFLRLRLAEPEAA